MSEDIPPPLTDGELTSEIEDLPGWSVVDGKLHKEFLFDNFVRAMGFMASAALIAERSGHHPEWSNVYNKVWIDLVTHDAGGITRFDTELARELNQLVAAP